MRRAWKVVGIAALVAIVGAVAVGAVAYAQDEDSNFPFDFGQRFREALADILGITVEEYDAAVDSARDQVVGEAVAEGWLTDDQAELFRFRMDQMPNKHFGFGTRSMPRSFGFYNRGMLGWGDSLLSITADQLDMSLTELLTEFQGGKSAAELAEEKGVETQAIVDAYLAELKADLDEEIADGDMTQKQADYYLERAEAQALDRLERTWEGRMLFRMPGRSGHGMRGGEMQGTPGGVLGGTDA